MSVTEPEIFTLMARFDRERFARRQIPATISCIISSHLTVRAPSSTLSSAEIHSFSSAMMGRTLLEESVKAPALDVCESFRNFRRQL